MYKILLMCITVCCAFVGLDNKLKLITVLHVLAQISYP